MVPAPGAGARRTRGPAGRGWRSLARPAAGGVPARHLSLVLRGTAGSVVGAQSARSARNPRNSRSFAQPRENSRNRGFEVTFDRDFGDVVAACAARREHSVGHLDHPRDACGLLRAARSRPCAQCRGATGGQSLSAGSTACCWDGCSSANPCSAASATPRKWPWPGLVERAARGRFATHRLSATYPSSALPGQQTDEPRRIQRAGRPIDHRGRRAAVLPIPEICSPEPLFWQNSPPSRVPQVPDVERRCDSRWKAKSSRPCLTPLSA